MVIRIVSQEPVKKTEPVQSQPVDQQPEQKQEKAVTNPVKQQGKPPGPMARGAFGFLRGIPRFRFAGV